jgi:hypothetical protein
VAVVDVAPVHFEAGWDLEFINYISYMRSLDLDKIRDRHEAESHFLRYIPVRSTV